MRSRSLKYLVAQSLVLALLAATAHVATAQNADVYRQQVIRQLNVVKAAIEDDGYTKTHEYKVDKMNRGAKDSFTLTLHRGTQYLLVSACDKDCTDVDITVFDSDGNQIAADTQQDDIPMVTVNPRYTGEYRIQVSMYRCNNNPCYYGIGAFGR